MLLEERLDLRGVVDGLRRFGGTGGRRDTRQDG
jgi:hypothetical protein